MKKIDLTGQKFNKLTVLEYSHRNHNSMWKCKCECGKESVVAVSALISGRIKSCGCIRSDQVAERNRQASLEPGESAFRALYSRYKIDAQKAGKWFDLTIEQFRDYTKMNCAYCGAQPSSIRKDTYRHNGPYIYNGLDRLDSRQGYDVYNVVPACKRCNQAKNDMALNDFFDWIRKLHTFSLGGVA